ncbi:uncharacterized protein LOC136080867 [Hydra vulgaris]|uniref:Uncharacterized protein LOC136080867 n=1 Tax=Hydra vulgaris TaxID=6087 RepID=A0ABM4BYG0_HYDVU
MHLVILAAMLSIAVAVPTYQFVCPSGTILVGRRDFSDQQPTGTNFVAFTCCPKDYPDFHYNNENYFCCPSGTGSYCMFNTCNCKTVELKGGNLPTLTKIAN